MDRSECCRCSQRKKERSPEEYKKLIHRLNRIEGQIRGIRSMVESCAYCPDIFSAGRGGQRGGQRLQQGAACRSTSAPA